MTNWNISLPSDATIVGIYFTVTAETSCKSGIDSDNGLYLIKGDGSSYSTPVPGSYTNGVSSHTYPSNANDPLWNTKWTSSDLSNVQIYYFDLIFSSLRLQCRLTLKWKLLVMGKQSVTSPCEG